MSIVLIAVYSKFIQIRASRSLLLITFYTIFLFQTEITAKTYEEFRLKAAYIYNFTKYVTWPEKAYTNKSNEFIVGVVGKDSYGLELDDALINKVVNEMPIVVKRLSLEEDLSKCQILIIGSTDKALCREIIDQLSNSHVLTVSDYHSFSKIGGMIQFGFKYNKLKYIVNLSEAKKVDLKFSSKILRIADKVIN